MSSSRVRLSCLVLLSACSISCSRADPRASTTPLPAHESRAWDAFVNEHIEAAFKRDPPFAAFAGRHEFDGQVQDFSLEAFAARSAEERSFHARALAFDELRLSPEQRFEREYVLATLDGAAFWSERVQQHRRLPLFYASAIDPVLYLSRDYAPLETRMRGYLALCRQIPRVVAQMKANLKLPLPRTFAAVGVQVFGGMGPYLERDVPSLFKSVDNAELQRELSEVTPKAVAALNDATTFLKEQEQQGTNDFALGPELFRELLWATERVDTPLAELEQVGREDLARNRAALEAACARFLPGQPLSACVERVARDKPPAGPVERAREQLGLLKKLVVEQDLVSVPSQEEAHVEEAPPYKRWNQAYIEIPGPYEHGQPSIYYIAPPDPSWSAADRLAYLPGEADLLFISVHEVWPGHFLQFLHAARAGRMYGRLFVGYAFAEGWAHYAEELMWEVGLNAGDESVHIGQLLNALLRNVRYLSALGLHTQGMTVEASEKMFLEQAFQDPGNARQQAARGTFDPAYLNYTLGKLMIRKMRADYTGPRGGRSAFREFHDRLLSFGGPPLPLIRRELLGDERGLLR